MARHDLAEQEVDCSQGGQSLLINASSTFTRDAKGLSRDRSDNISPAGGVDSAASILHLVLCLLSMTLW